MTLMAYTGTSWSCWMGRADELLNPEENINLIHYVYHLETAHPAKFPKEIMKILSINPELPESLRGMEDKPEFFEQIANDYPEFKKYLLESF